MERTKNDFLFDFLQAKLLENSAWLGASPSNIAGKCLHNNPCNQFM